MLDPGIQTPDVRPSEVWIPGSNVAFELQGIEGTRRLENWPCWTRSGQPRLPIPRQIPDWPMMHPMTWPSPSLNYILHNLGQWIKNAIYNVMKITCYLWSDIWYNHDNHIYPFLIICYWITSGQITGFWIFGPRLRIGNSHVRWSRHLQENCSVILLI